jgi:hypothetical protein
MEKHIISKDQVSNPHNRITSCDYITRVGWFFHFVVTSSSRILETFRIKKKRLVPTLGFEYLKIFNKPAGFNKELAKNWQFQGTFCDGLFGSLRTMVMSQNWLFDFLRTTGQRVNIPDTYPLVLSFEKERTGPHWI